MDYKTFSETIYFILKQQLSPEQADELNEMKLNGSLKRYYHDFKCSIPLSSIMEQLLVLFQTQLLFNKTIPDTLSDFSSVRTHLIFKLVPRFQNQKFLSDVFFLPFLDLAIVFCVMIRHPRLGVITAPVLNEQLSLWNITPDLVFTLARQNTPRFFPAQITPLDEALCELSAPVPGLSESDLPLYVLTNRTGIHGASCLLYQNVLKNFANEKEDDFIILPSSIHEVLLIPQKKAFSYKELNEMVSSINSAEVPMPDRLSDHAYHYSLSLDCIEVPFPYSVPDEIPSLQ